MYPSFQGTHYVSYTYKRVHSHWYQGTHEKFYQFCFFFHNCIISYFKHRSLKYICIYMYLSIRFDKLYLLLEYRATQFYMFFNFRVSKRMPLIIITSPNLPYIQSGVLMIMGGSRKLSRRGGEEMSF